MSTSNQRKSRRRRAALDKERAARSLSPLNIQSRYREKGRAAASFATTRAEQYDESGRVPFFLPGVKVRGKIGPAGWRKIKAWYKPENK